MTKKYSSYKNHQRATDTWREYVKDSSQEALHENNLGSAGATMKGMLKNVGDMKEPLRYAASETFKSQGGGAVR